MISIRTHGQKFDVIFETPEETALALLVPGGKKSRKNPQMWSWPVSPFVAVRQQEEWDSYECSYDSTWLQFWQDGQTLIDMGRIKNLSLDKLPEYDHKTDPWEHQRRAFWYLRGLSSGALFSDMRTGKSKVVVDLIVNRSHRRTLIVCPKSAIGGWVREFKNHSDGIVVVPLVGSVQDRIDDIRILADVPNPIVFITNYEALVYSTFVQSILSDSKIEFMVLDEAHKIKSPSGVTSKAATAIGKTVPYRLALTGTPAADKPTDVFGIYRFLDPTIFGTYAEFCRMYTVAVSRMNGQGQRWQEVVDYKNLEDLHERIYRLAFRVTQDVLDLPDVLHVPVPVILSPQTERIYRLMLKESVAWVTKDDQEFEATAANALAKLLRLQQISSGFIVDDTDKTKSPEPQRIGSEKSDALLELLEQVKPDQPVVVFCRFHQDLDQIRKVAEESGRRYHELSGRVDQLEDWQSATDGGVIGVQIQAGTTGTDFSRSSYVVYYSSTFSLSDFQQSQARVMKAGKTGNVTYWYLMAGSVDEQIYAALQSKSNIAEYLIDWLRTQPDSDIDKTT